MNSDKRPPIVIKKNNISVLKRNCLTSDVALLQCMKKANSVLVKEDVIYKSQPGDFLKGEYPDLIIINRLNLFANSSRTTAKYRSEARGNIERTSDEVTKVIGQKNYDTLFAALCSVISQEYRIQGILALLTVQKNTKNISCQTDLSNPGTRVELTSSSCQTDETCFDLIQRLKRKKKIRKPHQAPYVVQDLKSHKKIKKLVIKPNHFKDTTKLIDAEEKLLKQEISDENYQRLDDTTEIKSNKLFINKNSTIACSLKFDQKNSSCRDFEKLANDASKETVDKCKRISSTESLFPELKHVVDEDSNISDISCGNISINSLGIPNLVDNPIDILINIDKHTQESVDHPGTSLTMLDNTQVELQDKTVDCFHIATAETLKNLSPNKRAEVMWHQACIDWKLCLQKDEDENLPIHLAVLNNDVDLLRRQCAVLKIRKESVDIPAHGYVTALQIAITQDYASCTAVLLQYGANPLAADEEQRTAVHLAAEMNPDHLKAIISCCRTNARYILEENDCWKPELEIMSDDEISKYLLSKVCRMYDSQGYTPLMLASKLGKYSNVQLLLESDPSTINLPMPSCGNTALYEAVAAASIDAENRGNKSKIADHFLKTVEILVKLGADPSIENSSGHNVNILLHERNVCELSMLVANTIVSLKYSGDEIGVKKDFKSFMLVREEDGDVSLKELNNEKNQVISNENDKIIPKVIEKVSVESKILSSRKSDVVNKTLSPILKAPETPIKRKTITYQESKGAQLDVTKFKKFKNIVFIPVPTATGTNKIISVDKNDSTNKLQSKPITTTKVVKVSKIDLKNTVNVISVSSSNLKGNSAISVSNKTTTAKRIQNTNELTKPGLPIKKQKRDFQNT